MKRQALEQVIVVSAFSDKIADKVHTLENRLQNSLKVSAFCDDYNSADVSFDHCLFVVDCDEIAEKLSEANAFIAGYEHEENREIPLLKMDYIISDLEDLDKEDLEFMWNRITGQPCDVLDTERLQIRETTVDDIDDFYKIYKDPVITAYMEPLFEDPDEERAYQEMYIKNVYGLYGYGVWTVIEKKSGKIIGRAGVAPREGCVEPELGFVIGKEWQGQGYAKEACEAVLRYVADEFDIKQVIAVVHKDNQASRRLCQKLGFKQDSRVLQENHITFLKGE